MVNRVNSPIDWRGEIKRTGRVAGVIVGTVSPVYKAGRGVEVAYWRWTSRFVPGSLPNCSTQQEAIELIESHFMKWLDKAVKETKYSLF